MLFPTVAAELFERMGFTMNENSLGQRIAELRRGAGMTQEQLAARLGVSFQAVSKWENALSCPDVTLLPLLAEVFGVSIDSLFGRTAAALEPVILRNVDEHPPCAAFDRPALPWPDDGNFYFALFHGHAPVFDGPLSGDDPRERVEFCWEGPVHDLHSACGVRCGDVAGDVHAGGDVDCENVLGHLNAGGDVDCGGVAGNLNAGGDVDCGSVEGSVTAGGDADCGDVGGDVHADGDVDCADVGGNAAAGSDLDCADVGGSVTAGGDVECGDVNGNVVAGGGVKIVQ